MEEYAHLKNLLLASQQDGATIVQDRMPVPKYVQTSGTGSQSRWLMNAVNPSTNHAQHGDGGGRWGEQGKSSSSSVIITEDVNLKGFMQCLIKYAVSLSNS